MKILISAVSAKMGGAATYIKNLALELAALDSSDEFIFYVPGEQAEIIRGLSPHIRVVATNVGYSAFWKRFWFDQVTLRRIIKREKIDVLYSTANLGMFACPRLQILLVRNSLHFSKLYITHVLPRTTWVNRLSNVARRWLICLSVRSVDVVMTPSQTMLDELRQFVTVPAEKALVNYYGARTQPFLVNERGLDVPNEDWARECRLLYSSLYADHKNLTTLLRALISLVESGVPCRLITSANPNSEIARTTSRWREDSELATDPRISSLIEFTDVTSSENAANLYRRADVFVYPSVVESFGHTLCEAMRAGLPVVAADTAINREICRDNALYFSPFDSQDCARQIRLVIEDKSLRGDLTQRGLERGNNFQWKNHVDRLLGAFYQSGIEHSTPQPVINQETAHK